MPAFPKQRVKKSGRLGLSVDRRPGFYSFRSFIETSACVDVQILCTSLCGKSCLVEKQNTLGTLVFQSTMPAGIEAKKEYFFSARRRRGGSFFILDDKEPNNQGLDLISDKFVKAFLAVSTSPDEESGKRAA